MNAIPFRLNLRVRLLLTYLLVIGVGALTATVTTSLVAPSFYDIHMVGMMGLDGTGGTGLDRMIGGPVGLAALAGPVGLAALAGPVGLAALAGPVGLAA